jgi:hypothetical protein
MSGMDDVFKRADRARDLLARWAASGKRTFHGSEFIEATGLTRREAEQAWAHLVETEWLRPWCRDDWESVSKPIFEINFVLAEARWKEMGWRRVWMKLQPVVQFASTLIGLAKGLFGK